jgi:SAM-dependent methyltransferase
VRAAGVRIPDHDSKVLGDQLKRMMGEAFEFSSKSLVIVQCHINSGRCKFDVNWQPLSVVSHYDSWLKGQQKHIFGVHPDSRVMQCLEELSGRPKDCPVLDVGAGVGRNSIPIAELGYPVTAVEPTPSFSARIFEDSASAGVPLRIVSKSIFDPSLELPEDHYSLIIISEVVPELRSAEEVERLLRNLLGCLKVGGRIVLNAFIAPSSLGRIELVRQMAEACSSSFLAEDEWRRIIDSLPLRVTSQDSAYDYEKKRVPSENWPPTPWFEGWSLGRDIFRLPKGKRTPIELQWFVLAKSS